MPPPVPVDGTTQGGGSTEPPLPLWDRVQKGTLANGLTYYILPHAKPEKRAYLWLAVNAGSVQEDDDQRGLAHLVEHMAFNGTTHFEKMAIVNYLESIGMRFGADVNAYTDFDETVYQLEVPTDDPQFVDKGLDILRDWAGDLSFDPEEVEKERGVVLEEWRLGRGAWARLYDKQSPVLFAGSKYAERNTIGLPEIIKGAPRDTIVRFYKDWYRPDLMAVIVVGEITPAEIEKQIEAKFGDLKNPDGARKREHAAVPRADGMRISIETDAEMAQTQVSIFNEFAHRSESSESDFRRFVVDGLYQQMLNERLQTIQQRSDAPFVWAGSGTNDLTREIEAFARNAGAKEGKVEEALAALFEEVLRVERFGFSGKELIRAKRQRLRWAKQAATEIDKHDGRELTDEITRNFFQGELMPGRQVEAELTEKFIAGITLEELNSLASQYGGDDNRVVTLSGPDSVKMPSEKRVKEIIAAVAKKELQPWDDTDVADQLMAEKPKAGTVAKETTDTAHGVTTWTLSNGVKVMVKPTDFENDTVLIQGFSPGGTAQASDKQWKSARFASEVVGGGGLGALSDNDLDKVLSGYVANASAWIGETTEGVDANGSAADLETVLQLVHLTMTAPRRDETAFDVWKQSTKEWVKNRKVIPEITFWETMGNVMSKGHARRKPPEVADIDAVDLDQAMAFYQDRFGDAADFTFVIIGNVDVATLKPLVETYLASLPSKGRVEKEKDIGIKHPKGVTKKTVKRGKEPKSYVQLTFYGDQKWSRDDARDIRTLSEVLRIRLREVLREDMGGVYGVGVWGGVSRAPRQERSMTVQFGCAPENIDKLKKAVFDTIAELRKSGIGDDYLDKIRKTRVRARETDLLDNRAWADWLGDAARYGDDLDGLLDLEADLARVSSANVKAAAKKYLSEKQYILGVMQPED
jgi:zinc protease